ncbi:hypothetical protein GCM10019016_083710 [Streptomyces prasinosporus]|uniref:LamG-like jellyroll fold domain-containing protein n=1 Tax=Streptomyces prasinosporus TaxID=68256 RepID=A0ABP6U2W7_9ACTN
MPERTLLTESGPAALRGEILATRGRLDRDKGLSGITVFARHDSLDLTGSLTLEAWFTPGVPGYHQPIVAKGDTQYALKQTDRRVEFFICSDGQWIAVNWPVPDDWSGREHHVAGVFDADAGTLTLYVDGAVRATRATDRRPTSTTAPLSLASDADNQTREFDGTIRRARVYARALTTAELASEDRAPGDDGVRFWFDAATVRTERKRPAPGPSSRTAGTRGDNPTTGRSSPDGIVTADRRPGASGRRDQRGRHGTSASSARPARTGRGHPSHRVPLHRPRECRRALELVADGAR